MNNLTTTYDIEESEEMGSYNHSYLQMKIGALLMTLNKYTVCSELSLNLSGIDLNKFDLHAKEEIKPDVCIYPKRGLSRPNDILRMSEMPLLAIEVLSPKQGTYDILEKFKVYFELGVKSCWLVQPITEIITVYSSIDKHKSFVSGDVVDEVLEIRLPLSEIFQ